YDALEWLEGDALREHVVTDAYPAALYDHEGGHLHPLNYTLGLARAAQRAGARLYTSSPVRQLQRGTPASVITDGGRVTADVVILGTNAYHQGLVPELAGRVMTAANYMIATAPLSAE